MKRQIRIRFAGMEESSALTAAAHGLAHGLAWDYSEIIACWVGIRCDPEETTPGPRYSVRVDVTVPGHELVAKRIRNESVLFAMGHAFEDMKLQLGGIDPRINHAEYAATTPGVLFAPGDIAGEKRYGDRRSEVRRAAE